MTSQPKDGTWLTPPQLAKQLGVGSDKVLTWIRNGELRGVNVAERLSGRARWRISPAALEEFLRSRESSPPPPAPTYRKYHRVNTPRATREDDRRLAKNIPHEVRVKRMAVLMANRHGGWGAKWRSYVPTAAARYLEKSGIKVDEQVVKTLKAWWEEE